MRRDDVVQHIRELLVKAAEESPAAVKPFARFMASTPGATVSGLQVTAPDGELFFVAVYSGEELLDSG
jgi:hypothetical protein